MEPDTFPSAKRKRTNESLEPERNPQFWFDDGNIILRAEDTLFRVHRSVLSLHSEIMKDCFAHAQPGEDQIDACSVVHLSDSSSDITKLCEIVYAVYRPDEDPFDDTYLAAMARMGRKYEIRHLKTRVVDTLRNVFPVRLEQWPEAFQKVHNRLIENAGFIFDVLNMAYESRLVSIMPAAFLALYDHHDLAQIVSGVELHSSPHRTRASLCAPVLRMALVGRMTILSTFTENINAEILLLSARGQNGTYKAVTYCRRKGSQGCAYHMPSMTAGLVKFMVGRQGFKFPGGPEDDLLTLPGPSDWHLRATTM